MAEGIANLEAVIERLEAATADARLATREAHEATKAYRQARREAAATVEEIRAAAESRVDDLLGVAVAKGLEKYTGTIRTATEQAHDHVQKQFERLTNVCLYGNEAGKGVNLFDEMRDTLAEYRRQFEAMPPLPLHPDLPRLR